MNENLNLFKDLLAANNAPISLSILIFNLIIGSFISIILKIYYIKFGSTVNNREEFSNVFPFIILTTTLVIAIVKSSLALSLGLVGALSIVRFRTPIKEPEELAYLFLSIAVGLGLGASQTISTVVSFFIIIIILSIFKNRNKAKKPKNMFVTIENEFKSEKEKNIFLDEINEIMLKDHNEYELRRFNVSKSTIHLTMMVNFKTLTSLKKVMIEFTNKYPEININYLDQNQISSI